MKIFLKYRGQEQELDVPDGKTIADAAKEQGMRLLGSCGGQNVCAHCSCFVREGIEKLLTKNGEPYEHQEGFAPYVKTCQVTPGAEGISIDADNRSRRW